jgi:hypothetical protein
MAQSVSQLRNAEIEDLLRRESVQAEIFQMICFIDDSVAVHGSGLNDIPVMGLTEACERFPQASVVGGVGTPRPRQRLLQRS